MKPWVAAVMGGVGVLICATSVSAQKSKDTLRFAVQDVYKSMDPYLTPSDEAGFSRRKVFDSLIQFDEAKGEVVPLIAKSWHRIDDLTLEFELFDDIKFHSGNTLTADDVIYSLNFAADPNVNFPFKNRYTWIESLEKLSDYKFRLKAKQFYNQDLLHFAYRSLILDSKLHATFKDPADYGIQSPSGTGPYKVTKFDRNAGVTLTRYDGVKKMPQTRAPIGTMQAVFLPDRQTQIAQLLAGNIDLVPNVQPDNAKEIATQADFRTTPVNIGYYVYIGFDVVGRSDQKQLTDPRVRRALMMAIDRDAIAENIVATGGQRMDGMCGEWMVACAYSAKPPAYDPAGAKKLLAEAGYPDGFDLQIDTHAAMTDVGNAIAGYLRAIGVRASSTPMITAVWLKKRSTGDMPSVVMYLPTSLWPDSDYLLDTLFGSEKVDFVRDPVILENIKAGNATRDIDKRKAVYRVAFDRMMELYSYLPITTVPVLYSHSKDVRIEQNPVTPRSMFISDVFWN